MCYILKYKLDVVIVKDSRWAPDPPSCNGTKPEVVTTFWSRPLRLPKSYQTFRTFGIMALESRGRVLVVIWRLFEFTRPMIETH